jgi:tRNA G18 (ribose-2'-O)-methylase SpoU
MGHVLRVPFATAHDWPFTIDGIRRAGFQTIALTPRPDSDPFVWNMNGIGERLAIVVGAEGPGLSERAIALADRRVRIPMSEGVDSLNVVTALSIALFCLQSGRNSS